MRYVLEQHTRLVNPLRAIALVSCISALFGTHVALSEEYHPQAHAHNDYHHKRPLLDALENGFCSAEADIFLVDGDLMVGHTRFELKKGRTLESLYLKPLQERVAKNGGRVHKGGPTFMLLIDIKNKGEETYQVLRKQLRKYQELFTAPKDDSKDNVATAAVHAVISGARPIEAIRTDKERLCGIDGRLSDLESDKSPTLLPLISDNWRSHFQYRGRGEISPEEHAKLIKIVKQVHQAGRKVRFWATPETKEMWDILADAEVDHINTDKLPELRDFLKSRNAKAKKNTD